MVNAVAVTQLYRSEGNWVCVPDTLVVVEGWQGTVGTVREGVRVV